MLLNEQRATRSHKLCVSFATRLSLLHVTPTYRSVAGALQQFPYRLLQSLLPGHTGQPKIWKLSSKHSYSSLPRLSQAFQCQLCLPLRLSLPRLPVHPLFIPPRCSGEPILTVESAPLPPAWRCLSGRFAVSSFKQLSLLTVTCMALIRVQFGRTSSLLPFMCFVLIGWKG